MTLKGFAVLLQPESLHALLLGLGVTVEMAVLVILLSFVFGTVLAVARFGGERHPERFLARWAGRLAFAYIEIIRNLPMLLLMLAVYLVGRMPALRAAVIGMTVFTTALMAEIVRGGMNAIDQGQWEAALSQGFGYRQILRHIVLPQAFRSMIPPIVSQFITVLKDTSFAWGLGVFELTGSSSLIYTKYANPLETLTVVALVYFVLSYAMSRVAVRLERRLAAGTY